MPARLNTMHQRVCIYAVYRTLTCGVDRRYEHHVGIIKRLLEIIHMVAQSREAVWLCHGNHTTLRTFAGSREHGADFNGMVAIIVDDRD